MFTSPAIIQGAELLPVPLQMGIVDARRSKRYWEANQNDKPTFHTLSAVIVLQLSYYYQKKPVETYW